jgi:hypothetical protein
LPTVRNDVTLFDSSGSLFDKLFSSDPIVVS